MKDVKTILENAAGNMYFFLSEEAEAINNSSIKLDALIKKAIPVANLVGRHLNIYGYNPQDGINFVCRVLPNGEVDSERQKTGDPFITASDIGSDLITLSVNTSEGEMSIASLDREDLKSLFSFPGVLGLLQDKISAAKIVPKPYHRKLRDKAVNEKEMERQGLNIEHNFGNLYGDEDEGIEIITN